MKKCPHCGFIGWMNDMDGYVLQCPECKAFEIEDEFIDVEKCSDCNGTGTISYEDGDHYHEMPCDKCNCTGWVRT